jgi:hypothetical protein
MRLRRADDILDESELSLRLLQNLLAGARGSSMVPRSDAESFMMRSASFWVSATPSLVAPGLRQPRASLLG